MPIDKCLQYTSFSSQTTCTLCEDDYYLKMNKCIIRDYTFQQSISNCIQYSPTSDECMNCAEGFALSRYKLQCWKMSENC